MRGLALYEKMQKPQARALGKLIGIGFPYQYNHMPIRGGVKLFTILLRNIVHKALPFLVAPPVFFMIQDCRLTYAQVGREKMDGWMGVDFLYMLWKVKLFS